MKKKILITGSEGFLGKIFVKIIQKNYNFIKYDKKINGDLSLKKNFSICRYSFTPSSF